MHRFAWQKNGALALGRLASRVRQVPQFRIKYAYLPYEATPNAYSLLENISKRRDHCIQMVEADYLFMLDADAKLLDRDLFKLINIELGRNPKGLCIYQIIHEIGVLPIFPIGFAKIDQLNFCVKASLAKAVGYPITVNPDAIGNDYWYFDRVYKATDGDYLFIDKIFGQHNGNNRYKNIIKLTTELRFGSNLHATPPSNQSHRPIFSFFRLPVIRKSTGK